MSWCGDAFGALGWALAACACAAAPAVAVPSGIPSPIAPAPSVLAVPFVASVPSAVARGPAKPSAGTDADANGDADAGADADAGGGAPGPQEQLYLAAMRALAAGRPDDAAALLTRFLAGEPQHAGAWLDLAISQCELAHPAEAERLFGEIEARFAPPPGIREVIRSYRARGCTPPAPPAQWSLALARGHDSNANQGASNALFSTGSGDNYVEWQLAPDYLPQPDSYTQLSADFAMPVGPAGTVAIVQLRGKKNDTLNQQDTASVLLGADQPWRWGRWAGRATLAAGLVHFDHALYQRQLQLQLRAKPPLALPAPLDWSVTAVASRVAYPTRLHYDASSLELSTALACRGARYLLQGAAGWLGDRGDRSRPGGDRRGGFGSLLLSARAGAALSGELGWVRQDWRGGSAYAPGLIDVVRRQSTTQLRATLAWAVAPRHSVLLEWREVKNRENISLFQYNSRTVQLSYRWDSR